MGKDLVAKMKTALMTGKEVSAEHALKVLKSDEMRLLSDFFEFEPQNLKITANLLGDGSVELSVLLKAKRFKESGKILD